MIEHYNKTLINIKHKKIFKINYKKNLINKVNFIYFKKAESN